MATVLSSISEIQSNLNKKINDLSIRVEKNSLRIERNSKEMKLLESKCASELSQYHIKEEENVPYVFSAPPRNRYFAGRTEEIQELKRILLLEETLKEKKVHVAAVCGLGGVGKTILASEYAHQMKDFYKGGVYWFSAEDVPGRTLRSSNNVKLEVPLVNGTFQDSAAAVFNNLPADIRNCSNFNIFRRKGKDSFNHFS